MRTNVARFDERRNTSRVWPVPPDALPRALQALAAFKRSDPELYAWVAEGAPRLTEAQHWRRFGESYERGVRRRRGPSDGPQPPDGIGVGGIGVIPF